MAHSETAVTVLHVSPHPDDEVLGAGAALTTMRDLGWRVVNLGCSLGRPKDHDRRLAELEESTRRLGVESLVCEPPLAISSKDDLEAAEERLVDELRGLYAAYDVQLVISPQSQDLHHGHEVVGRAVQASLEGAPSAPSWWQWGLWADLRRPTVYVPFDRDRLERMSWALAAHTGELARNGYDRLLEARATANAVLGSERVFGFGAPSASEAPFAELYTEVGFTAEHGWRRARPRTWTGVEPLAIGVRG